MATAAQAFRANAAFITVSTHHRQPIFEVSRVAELFIDTLRYFRARGDYKLHAYLVMPDHVHLLLTPQSGTLEQTIALIQKEFVRRLASRNPVWDAGLIAHSIRNLRDLEKIRSYLHQAPVRANLAASPGSYPYSSAHRVT